MKLVLIISSLFYFVTLMLMQDQGCNGWSENEKMGLLEIKDNFLSQNEGGSNNKDRASWVYLEKELVSWVDERDSNCCSWNRVKCSNFSSGHITELSLKKLKLPMLNVSLFRPFEELRLLDLSENFFDVWIGDEGFPRLKKLETLDLSFNMLNVSILLSLKGLTALRTLNLGYGFDGAFDFSTQGFPSSLKKLETLDFSGNDLIYDNSILPSLKGLTALTTLILSDDSMEFSFFAQGFPKLKKLETLDLSENGLGLNSTSILPSLNGLTALTTLKLGENLLDDNFSAQGFSRSKELKVLDISNNKLNCNIIPRLHGFTSLTSLILNDNEFNCSLSTLDLGKFSRLELLDLGYNVLAGSLSIEDVQHLRNLKMLRLSNNQMSGSIEGLCKLKDLVELDISGNMFSGQLPECLSNLTNLRVLELSNNLFSGNFPSFTTNLTSLRYLSFYGNYMGGSFSLSILANHSNLQVLYISSQSIGAHIDTEKTKWFPKFQLKSLILRNCNLNKDKGSVIPTFLSYQYNLILVDLSINKIVGSFPSWLMHNNDILYLDISNNNLSGLLPKDFNLFLPSATQLNFSRNSFEGNIPSSIGKMKQLQLLDFSHNHFSGELPEQLATNANNLLFLSVSNNFLSGNIPKFGNSVKMEYLFLDNNNFRGTLEDVLGNNTELAFLSISNNSFSGTIPSSIGTFSNMEVLLMAENILEGEIPIEISNMSSLETMDLSQNKLIGSIPNSISSLKELNFLYLQKNDLSGSLPYELFEDSKLQLLDLRENKFSGKIPNWIDKLSELRVLLLGGNKLEGDIPIQLCRLKKINMMDLSHNMLNASIPSCFQNLSFGIGGKIYQDRPIFVFSLSLPYGDSLFNATLEYGPPLFESSHGELHLEVEFRTKHNDYFYKGKVLEKMTGLDLSCNKLTSTIPSQIGHLQQVRALNLSHNYLSGPIPISFFNLTQIESLDLSYNNLSGKIPYELTQLTFLSTFNVSYNNLSGTPPSTRQFANFDEDNYRGNPGLCGQLLNRKCERVESSPSPQSNDNEEKETNVDMITFYWSFTASYITILLAFITVLCINPRWRMAWFYYISKFMRRFFPTFPLY